MEVYMCDQCGLMFSAPSHSSPCCSVQSSQVYASRCAHGHYHFAEDCPQCELEDIKRRLDALEMEDK